MAGKLNRFQTQTFSSWKGLTKDTHLGAAFLKSPQKASNLMIQLMAAKRGKTIETFLSKFPTKQFDTDDEYTWDVIGSSKRNIPLVEARNEEGIVVTDNNTMIGAGTAPFTLVFAEDWFADGRVFAVA